jgi:hypothetical protein
MSKVRWDRLEQLFAAARRESPPATDVTRAVLGRIARQGPVLADVDRTLAWCALGSVAAAGIMAIVASGAFSDLLDPLNALMQSCDVVLR